MKILLGRILFFGVWLVGLAALPAGYAASDLSLEARPLINLSGEWEFKLDPLDVGRAEKWFQNKEPYERRIHVPGAWNAQGVNFAAKPQLLQYEEQRLTEQKALNKLGTLGVQRESERLFSVYPGPAWYRKSVTIPADWSGKIPWLIFAGVHREAEVWINRQPAGTHHSYLIPFRIDLSPYTKPGEQMQIDVRVDARRRPDVDPLMGCLDTLDFLYVTWGGLHGPVRIEATAATRIGDVFVKPQLTTETAEINVEVGGQRSERISVSAEIVEPNGLSVASAQKELGPNSTSIELSVPVPKAKLWSPKSPFLYTVGIRLMASNRVIDTRAVRFGMREFRVAGSQFLLNGQPIFLRGYGDDCIYPLTICPPSDKAEFQRRLSLARAYGFNYVRHHSWTPPVEYLEAADELGMMLQPEFPFAYRWDLPATAEAKRSALEQWEANIRLHRNHPSIVTWCLGNELYDSFDLAPEMYRIAKRLDPSRPVIDSDGCNFKHKERDTLDFLVVQFNEGSSIGFQDSKYNIPKDVSKPVVAHEMGYFVTLPQLNQFDFFQNGLRPYWLYQARNLVTSQGLEKAYPEWLKASYRLQAVSLKSNLEAARRSRLNGTSVWLFQDYPNCAEGVVDMFFHPKGVPPEEFRKYNSSTVLLLETPRRNWRGGESIDLKFAVSRFEDEPTVNARLNWKISTDDETMASGGRDGLQIRAGGVQDLPASKWTVPNGGGARQATLSAELIDSNGRTENSWRIWIFPPDSTATPDKSIAILGFDRLSEIFPNARAISNYTVSTDTDLILTTQLRPGVINYLSAGGSVFLLDPEGTFPVEKTNFRLSSWDGGGPSGTIFDRQHPALRYMPSEGWCDLQFYPLIQGSKSILLNSLPNRIEPLVRCIDRPTRLADRAYLFEVSVGRGKLLVSGFNFAGAIELKDPAAAFLLNQFVRYALGPNFSPLTHLPVETLKQSQPK